MWVEYTQLCIQATVQFPSCCCKLKKTRISCRRLSVSDVGLDAAHDWTGGAKGTLKTPNLHVEQANACEKTRACLPRVR